MSAAVITHNFIVGLWKHVACREPVLSSRISTLFMLFSIFSEIPLEYRHACQEYRDHEGCMHRNIGPGLYAQEYRHAWTGMSACMHRSIGMDAQEYRPACTGISAWMHRSIGMHAQEYRHGRTGISAWMHRNIGMDAQEYRPVCTGISACMFGNWKHLWVFGNTFGCFGNTLSCMGYNFGDLGKHVNKGVLLVQNSRSRTLVQT